MNPRVAAATIAALISIAFLVGIATAATNWTVTITGPGGGKHVYTVSTDTEAEAIEAGWDAHRAAQRSIVAVPVGPPPSGGYPSIADNQAEFDGDFDSACNLYSGDGSWLFDSGDIESPSTINVVTDRVAEGTCAARFVKNGSGGSRAELRSPVRPLGSEITWEFLMWVPSNVTYIGFVSQTKMRENSSTGSCANGGVAVSDRNNPAQLEMVTRSHCNDENVRTRLGLVPRDRWFAVKVHERFSDSGFAEAWVDPDGPGPQPYERRMPLWSGDTVSGHTSVTPRFGIYGDSPAGTTFWGDGFRLDCQGGC